MIRLYGMTGSGNCYKPALLMRQLGIAYEWVELNIVNGDTRTADYLQRNPNGKVPLLEFGDGRRLAESNAMLCFLAEGSPLFPDDRWARAQILQWLFFEQYSHEPYIATTRYWLKWCPPKQLPPESRIVEAKQRGRAALAVMAKALTRSAFIAGDHYSIADIALYAYTHVADEAGFNLDSHPEIRRWLDRVADQAGYVSMEIAALGSDGRSPFD